MKFSLFGYTVSITRAVKPATPAPLPDFAETAKKMGLKLYKGNPAYKGSCLAFRAGYIVGALKAQDQQGLLKRPGVSEQMLKAHHLIYQSGGVIERD